MIIDRHGAVDSLFRFSSRAPFITADRRPCTVNGPTYEQIHESIVNRNLTDEDEDGSVSWPCALLNGEHDEKQGWQTAVSNKWLPVAEKVIDTEGNNLEDFFKGRISKIVEDPKLKKLAGELG